MGAAPYAPDLSEQPFNLSEIVEIAETRSSRAVNEFLARGYRLIGIVPVAHMVTREGVSPFVLKRVQYTVGRAASVEHWYPPPFVAPIPPPAPARAGE